ncbi:MAG: EAL domain-containing protein, partial [Raoultibacter sp.]
QAVGNRVRYAVYDDEVRRLLFREKQLEDMMEQAIPNKEFQVYLQPQYKLPERTIDGAEALARWVSESEGMIFPEEFIPLFEKNGFIITLDLFVFEEVCRILQSWLDGGKPVMKVSVNCSRAHLRDRNFIDQYRQIAQKYEVPEHLINIELTESIVMEDSEFLIGVIEAIHEAGFECSIDDFGSGYSSLNMIQAIPADSLKLDKIFFRDKSKDPERTKSVVRSIVSMAKALSMDTIAEGVERWDQVEMLEDIGCDYVQGYVFACPMPVNEFEELVEFSSIMTACHR